LGDHILLAKYSGSEIQLDDAEYMIMRQDDILGILDSATPAARKAT
jgi:chaperonin GroES